MTWFRRGSDLLSNSAAHNGEEEAETLPEWCCALAEAVLELVYELLSSLIGYTRRGQQKGRIDVLFANAGTIEVAPLGSITESHFDKNIQYQRLTTTIYLDSKS
jgi:NAD(P)-dependent dehydrogenase (short-subunit alcohol dehydrogenase family)